MIFVKLILDMQKKYLFRNFNIKDNRLHKILLNFLGNLFFCYCLIVCLSLILFSSVTIECKVNGSSMQPTLNGLDTKKNDYVYVNIYDNDYNYGDMVVVNVEWDSEPIIKRIVGLPGDVIDIVYNTNEWKLERNGEIVNENYIFIDEDPSTPTSVKNGMNKTHERFERLKENKKDSFINGKYVVKENEIFALGDHRSVSIDSSEYGGFAFDSITGKVELIRYYDDNTFSFYFDYVTEGKFVKTLINIFR